MSVTRERNSVMVAGEVFWLTDHVLERYVERVKPAFTRSLAIADLARVLPHSDVASSPPAWMSLGPVDGSSNPDRWLVLYDALVFPVQGHRVLSCMVRGVRASAGQGRRASRKRRVGLAGRDRAERASRSGARRMQERDRAYDRRREAAQ